MEMAIELPLGARRLRVRLALGSRVTALMGPSGAGKTSLLEVLAGLRPGVRGRIALGDVVWLDTNAGIQLPPNERRVGYVPQDAGLFPHLTVRRNVAFGARAEREAASAAIDMLEIRPLLDRHPVSLSGGERQRVAVARALALRPRLLLMDEPLASLDVALRGRILPYLIRIRDELKVPCLYVTHSVGEALALAEHLVLLRDGVVEAEGRPGALLASPVVVEEAGAGLENLLDGRVVLHQEAGGTTSVELRGGMRLAIPLALEHAVGTGLTLAVRAEDVLVSNREIHGLSARNVFPAGITALDRTGVDVTLRCAVGDASAAWLVRVTQGAVEALGLEPGSEVWLAVKSHSIRVV